MSQRKIRYAVVGLGHIAQVAVLPGFANAKHAELVALFSRNPTKLATLGDRYRVPGRYDYASYDAVLARNEVDAVYIALPNHLHHDFTMRALERGVHVLVEKPMAVDEAQCHAMIDAATRRRCKLMVAYRLHFDRANLEAVEVVRCGHLGNPRAFNSVFSQNVIAGNVRLMPVADGGGPVYDMGIYCINAARYLFRAEPIEVVARAASSSDPRFRDSPEMVTATLRFPGERLATFTCSFGAADSSRFEVLGDRGRLVMEPAFEYATELRYEVEKGGEIESAHRVRKHDQFGAEIEYFAQAILEDRDVEPGGHEGLADVQIIRAIHRSIELGRALELVVQPPRQRPDATQQVTLPGVRKPETVDAVSPSGE
jgi:predicted dehydrogenase